MKGEIDRDFYCQLTAIDSEGVCQHGLMPPVKCYQRGFCKCRQRKWPTPEQFAEERGEKWDGACYSKCFSDFCKSPECIYAEWSDFPKSDVPEGCDKIVRVCACAPFGRPPEDWRPS